MHERLKIIDGLRGIAILAVVWHHLFSHITVPGFLKFGPEAAPFLPLTFLANGWLGVNLFFVLSGFVLFYPYVTGERSFSDFGGWKTYYRNRAFRLLPLYYVSVIYGFIFVSTPQTTGQWIRDGLLMATATFNFTRDLWYPPYNWVMWSLGIEIWFSVLFPFLVVLANKLSVVRTAVVVAVLALVVRYVGLQGIFEIPGSPYLGPLRDSVLGRLDDFFLGMFIAWYWVNAPSAKSSKWAKIQTVVIGMVLIFVASHLWDYHQLGLLPKHVVPLINNVLLAGLFLAIMYVMNSAGVISRILNSRFFTVPGVMCYSIYLWHGVLMVQIIGADRQPAKVIFYLIVMGIVSRISFEFIEMNKRFRSVRPKPNKAVKQRHAG